MSKACQTSPQLHPKFITTRHKTSQHKFVAWPSSTNNHLMLATTHFLPCLPMTVLGKRKSVHETRNEKASSRSKRRRYQEESVVMQMTHHCRSTNNKVESSTEKCAKNFLQGKQVKRTAQEFNEETMEPFLNVLAKLGKHDAPLLAQDIKQLNITGFPMDAMAEKQANKMIMDQKAAESSLETAVDSSIDVAVKVRSLISDLRQSLTNPSTEVMDKLEDFDEVSQSFGLQNAINHLDFLDQYISCLCTKLSKKNEHSFRSDPQS